MSSLELIREWIRFGSLVMLCISTPALGQSTPQTPDLSELKSGKVNPDESVNDDSDSAGVGFSFSPLNTDPQMFFDAQSTGITRDGFEQVLRGDVVAVGGGVLLTADEVRLNRRSDTIEATGHVILLSENQIFLADRILYSIKSTDLKLTNAIMVMNDKDRAEDVSRKVLGFTPAELAFEAQKNKRLAVVEQRKAALRDQFAEDIKRGKSTPSPEIIDQYALLLEQGELTQNQENPFFAKMNSDRRRRYKARRLYWQKGQGEFLKQREGGKFTAYFSIEGATIERRDSNDYYAEDAFWTPCKCEDEESPAWGFRASRMKGQLGGYVDLYHPILEIKGVPVLYLPYLKVPIKEKRQSGLIMPTFAHRKHSGNIYSQPTFFALRDNLDATLTTELHERRGTKLGLEVRYQERTYSGWSLQLEGMKDRVWNEDRRRREAAQSHYFADDEALLVKQCKLESKGDPKVEAQCLRLARERLALPNNDWRGAQQWQGMTFLAPRLSFVSSGKVYSDHRYVEDLTLFEDFKSALDASSRATMFSTARYQLHLDAKNFYVGGGGSFGDNVLTNDRFLGQQIPYQFSAQSRLIELDRGFSPIPIYAQLSGRHLKIADFHGKTELPAELDGENRTLGEGYWQQLKLQQISPLIIKGPVQLDQFLEWEVRGIEHSHMAQKLSTIRSWRTGFTLNLPIDGVGSLAGLSKAGEFGQPYGRHYMNWAITFSLRPEVVRSGPYGAHRSLYFQNGKYNEGPELVYFMSDRRIYNDDDSDVDRNDTMIPHKRISFSTYHTWDLFDRGWERIPAAPAVASTVSEEANVGNAPVDKPESYQDRAKLELLNSVDRNVLGVEDMFDEERKAWFINRYRLTDKNIHRLLEFKSDISFDFLEEKRRDEERSLRRRGLSERPNAILPQPWSPAKSHIRLNLFRASLVNELKYNLYYHRAVEQKFSLELPTYLATKVTLGVNIGNEPQYSADTGSLDFIATRERFAKASTGIIPNIMLSAWLGRRSKEVSDPSIAEQYQTIFGVEYISTSDCWRLAFQRQKKYDQVERDAEYLLQLTVLFLGRERSLPNLAEGFNNRE